MSIKENLQVAREEISSDEKMLESVFRIEGFLRKYKYIFIALLLVGIGWLAYIWAGDYFREKRAIESSELMSAIEKNPQDTQAWDKLKNKNFELYEMMKFSRAITNSNVEELASFAKSSNPLIAHYSSYEVATLNKSFVSANFGEFLPLALLQEGYMAIQNKNREEALKKLDEIGNDLDLRDFANRIGHYGL